jgi:cytochrome c biogenesis protein CcmG/thiol:disulfide interchange protein DsbE
MMTLKLNKTAISLGVGFLMTIAMPWALASLEVGEPAPHLTAKTIDGQSFSLADAAGKVVIINFWATWCDPCRKEMPAMETYYKAHKDQGLRILAISMDDPEDEAKVREVMKTYSYPAAFQRDADFSDYGRIWRMPMTFIIDRHGILRKDGGVGPPSIDLELLEKVVTPLLNAVQN